MPSAKAIRDQLRAHALKHPEAWSDEPWPGDHVAKVGKKIFAFLTTVAINIGMYQKIEFGTEPAEYCGLMITDSIV